MLRLGHGGPRWILFLSAIILLLLPATLPEMVRWRITEDWASCRHSTASFRTPHCSPPLWYSPQDWPQLVPYFPMSFVPLKILTLFQLLVILTLTPSSVAGFLSGADFHPELSTFPMNDCFYRADCTTLVSPLIPCGFSHKPTLKRFFSFLDPLYPTPTDGAVFSVAARILNITELMIPCRIPYSCWMMHRQGS